MTILAVNCTLQSEAGKFTATYTPATTERVSAGGSLELGTFNIADGDCAWTAAPNATWITVTGSASGTGNGSVAYTTAANSGAARSGTLTIAGETLTVTQAEAPPPPPPLAPPPPPAPPVSLTGTWNGTANDSQGGITVTWLLTQAGTTVLGTVRTQAANPNDGSCNSCHRNKSGTFSGTIAGTTLTMRMFFAAGGSGDPTPACSSTLTGTASPIASDSFTTAYSGADTCEGAFNNGTLTMARRP